MWHLGGERLYLKFCTSNIVCIPELCTLKVYFTIWLNFIIQCYLMAEVIGKRLIFWPWHTLPIWIFTFHEKLGSVYLIWKANLWSISNHPTHQRYHFFDLKIQTYYSHFSSIFCRNCQIHYFLHTVNAISKRLKYLNCIFCVKWQFKYFISLE